MSRKNVTIESVKRAVNAVKLQRIVGRIGRAADAGRLSVTQSSELLLMAYGLQRRNSARPAKRKQ